MKALQRMLQDLSFLGQDGQPLQYTLWPTKTTQQRSGLLRLFSPSRSDCQASASPWPALQEDFQILKTAQKLQQLSNTSEDFTCSAQMYTEWDNTAKQPLQFKSRLIILKDCVVNALTKYAKHKQENRSNPFIE